MLPKKFRLPAEYFGKDSSLGDKVRGVYGMFVVRDNSVGNPRFGFILSKKIGNAVQRHRMTRLLRVATMEAVNEKNISSLSKDFLYIAFKFCDKKNLLRDDILKQLEKRRND